MITLRVFKATRHAIKVITVCVSGRLPTGVSLFLAWLGPDSQGTDCIDHTHWIIIGSMSPHLSHIFSRSRPQRIYFRVHEVIIFLQGEFFLHRGFKVTAL
jgi:hypothetical protein